jgi:hypothetical protein
VIEEPGSTLVENMNERKTFAKLLKCLIKLGNTQLNPKNHLMKLGKK